MLSIRETDVPKVEHVHYPMHNACRSNYEMFRKPNGGYGGLLSVTFSEPDLAKTFFDTIETQKGPSLGTNFTLT